MQRGRNDNRAQLGFSNNVRFRCVSTNRSANASTLMALGGSKKCWAIGVEHNTTPLLSASTSSKHICSTGSSCSSMNCALSSSNGSGSIWIGPTDLAGLADFFDRWLDSWAPCLVLVRLAIYAARSSAVTRRKRCPGLLAAALSAAQTFLPLMMLPTWVSPSLLRTN